MGYNQTEIINEVSDILSKGSSAKSVVTRSSGLGAGQRERFMGSHAGGSGQYRSDGRQYGVAQVQGNVCTGVTANQGRHSLIQRGLPSDGCSWLKEVRK